MEKKVKNHDYILSILQKPTHERKTEDIRML